MFLIHFILALLIAGLFTAIFAAGFRGHRSRTGLLGFFLILLFATWAIALWVPPFGWTLYGVAWLPFLMIGFFLALIMLAFIPPARPPVNRQEARQIVREQQASLVAFDLFFWVLLGGLLVVILTSYFF